MGIALRDQSGNLSRSGWSAVLYPHHRGARAMRINFNGSWVWILYVAWIGLMLFVVSIILDVW
jgi:hypothetical protein